MNFIKQILILVLLSLSALVLSSRAYSANDYSMSCTNTAYDGSLSSLYLNAGTSGGVTAYGVYSHFMNKSNLLEDEELSKPICLVETVKNMRLQRHPWMVEGLKQYEMAYNISLHLLLEMSS